MTPSGHLAAKLYTGLLILLGQAVMVKRARTDYWISRVFAVVMFSLSLGVTTVCADQTLQTIDYYVQHRSSAPSMEGQFAQLYLREKVRQSTLGGTEGLEGRVVLFIAGSYIPAEVAFDFNVDSYSWMAFLAAEGFDTFAVDITGHGRSTRPHAMNDPCNLADDNRLAVGLPQESCEPSYPFRINTVDSEWADINRVVDHIRELRGVSRLSLVGWSTGGLRAGGFAAKHPEKIDRLVLFAPGYTRSSPSKPPIQPPKEAAMSAFTGWMQSEDWLSQVECSGQYDPAIDKLVWSETMKSDAVGATWGDGIVRGPRTSRWFWNNDAANGSNTPMLLLVGDHDSRSIDRALKLYEDSGAEEKVFVNIACASHFAQYESSRNYLFDASLQWFRDASVNGVKNGRIRVGE